jgi:hypothetical protein
MRGVGASSDASEDIAWWVFAQGEETYQKILTNPMLTPHTLPEDRAGLGFMSQIGNLFYERCGEELTEIDLGVV